MSGYEKFIYLYNLSRFLFSQFRKAVSPQPSMRLTRTIWDNSGDRLSWKIEKRTLLTPSMSISVFLSFSFALFYIFHQLKIWCSLSFYAAFCFLNFVLKLFLFSFSVIFLDIHFILSTLFLCCFSFSVSFYLVFKIFLWILFFFLFALFLILWNSSLKLSITCVAENNNQIIASSS